MCTNEKEESVNCEIWGFQDFFFKKRTDCNRLENNIFYWEG